MTSIITSVITTIGVVVSATFAGLSVAFSRKSIKSARESADRQNRFNLFVEYTHRYQDIILNLYSNPEKREEYMRLYFDLCSEEFYLHKEGMIDDYIWDLWVDGMRMMMNNQQNQTAWIKLGGYFGDNSFICFMDNVVINQK